MIDFALASPRWDGGDGFTSGSHTTGELWRRLFGMDRYGADVWNDQLRARANRLRSRIAVWSERHLAEARNVAALANFLTFPAASGLVLDGVKWFDRAAVSLAEEFWSRGNRPDSTLDAVFTLLSHAWTQHRDSLRRDRAAFAAFRRLLQPLVERQYPPALELSDRVGLPG
jgi:hypothetical protein